MFDLLDLRALRAEVNLAFERLQGSIDTLDLLVEGLSLRVVQLDLLAGVDFEWAVEVGLDGVKTVPLVSHALVEGGEGLVRWRGVLLDELIHLVDLGLDLLNILLESLLAFLECGLIGLGVVGGVLLSVAGVKGRERNHEREDEKIEQGSDHLSKLITSLKIYSNKFYSLPLLQSSSTLSISPRTGRAGPPTGSAGSAAAAASFSFAASPLF